MCCHSIKLQSTNRGVAINKIVNINEKRLSQFLSKLNLNILQNHVTNYSTGLRVER